MLAGTCWVMLGETCWVHVVKILDLIESSAMDAGLVQKLERVRDDQTAEVSGA